MRSFLLFLWACSRLFGWRVRSTLCKLQLSPRAAPCYTYVIFMMMRGAILCKIATLPLETPRIVATLHRVLPGYLPLLPFALLEIRTGLYSCSAASDVGKSHRFAPELLQLCTGSPLSPALPQPAHPIGNLHRFCHFIRVAICTGLAFFAALATLHRLLCTQENGGKIHRFRLFESTGLGCCITQVLPITTI